MSEAHDGNSPHGGWTILRSGDQEASGITIPTFPIDVVTSEGSVRLALGKNGEARLLLPLGEADSAATVVGAPALEIVVSNYAEGGRSRRFLDLTCLAPELEKAFTELVDEILARIRAGASCVDAAHSTIEEFRSLLTRQTKTDVPEHKIAGLIGELLYLNRLLDRSAQAWRSWRGPTGARHDFSSGAVTLEVKCTLRKGKSKITVNGLDQLEAPAGGILYLQHFEIEATTGGMLSVSALGGAALSKADDPEELAKLLSAMGCKHFNDPAWNSSAYRLEGEALYLVGEGFPRLVSSMLSPKPPPGIFDVCYTSDLSVASAFRLEHSRVVEVEEALQCL